MIAWDTDDRGIQLPTHHNEAGRGAEFSELAVFYDRVAHLHTLYTFDDRTGLVFEVNVTKIQPPLLETNGTKEGEYENYRLWTLPVRP